MILELSQKILAKTSEIKKWSEQQRSLLGSIPPPIYTSVDIRNSGHKMAVVDTNIYPAGFNNLCDTFADRASEEFKNYLRVWAPAARKILIYPEEHTRNLYYWKNIAALSKILTSAGFEVKVGSSSTLFEYPHPITLEADKASSQTIIVERIELNQHVVSVGDFIPDVILLNNDLATGVPDYFYKIHQPLLPSPSLGWHQRKKGHHFALYDNLIDQLAMILETDPWLLKTLHYSETGIDLSDEICLKRLQETADKLLGEIRQKYFQHGIAREPYLFLKNSSGTYGMGITHIKSGKEILEMGRKLRNKLTSAKGGVKVSDYLLQEGIPTADFYKSKPVEPVVYLVGGNAVGTFFRIHEEKSDIESLNAPGMSFQCLCLHKFDENKKSYHLCEGTKEDMFIATSLLGYVASLATAFELKELVKIENQEIA
ncbi:MAG: glutamate--cysteine ligase [Deltaproteobacteria bacterium]|nr:MAG: glutamate--cysteine ligase [Deltaproteobacteria bacterium]